MLAINTSCSVEIDFTFEVPLKWVKKAKVHLIPIHINVNYNAFHLIVINIPLKVQNIALSSDKEIITDSQVIPNL